MRERLVNEADLAAQAASAPIDGGALIFSVVSISFCVFMFYAMHRSVHGPSIPLDVRARIYFMPEEDLVTLAKAIGEPYKWPSSDPGVDEKIKRLVSVRLKRLRAIKAVKEVGKK